jgi:hypothetical protein
MSYKMWMIWGSPRTTDRLLELCGSRVQQSKVCETMTDTCGPYNLGGSTTLTLLILRLQRLWPVHQRLLLLCEYVGKRDPLVFAFA